MFEVADEEAGGLVQCPRCGLLRDIPNASDLKGLDDEGLYKLDDNEPRAEPGRLAELGHVFQPGRVDEQGEEIDLRQTIDDLMEAGTEEVPLELKEELRPAAPKYDPETGELIRPLPLKGDEQRKPQKPKIPIAKPALNYATTALPGPPPEVSVGLALAHLFMPANLIVIFFILLAHLFTQIVMIPTMAGLFLMVPITFMLNMLIVSHYACVIDETGPEARDELPRPLRHLGWHEDLWGPFVNFAAAMLFSYAPMGLALFANFPGEFKLPIVATMLGLGCIIFPAALLTSATSGTFNNLRPDRVIGTMRLCGWKYPLAVALWVAVIGLYGYGNLSALLRAVSLFSRMGADPARQWMLAYGLLTAGIFLMHYFCWLLGLLYREHHAQFPWVLQRHSNLNGPERLAWEAGRQAVRRHNTEIRQARRTRGI
jgi:hypothetical protein